MVCKKCGNPLSEDEKFCTKCGTPVDAESAQPETQTKPKTSKKTRLGIAAGLIAAIAYFCTLSGYAALVLVIIAGYVLLAEENVFLRKSVVKAIAVAGCFMLLRTAINLIPSLLRFINEFLYIFETGFDHSKVDAVFSVLASIVGYVKLVLVVLLGVFALGEKTIRLPVIDKLIDHFVK